MSTAAPTSRPITPQSPRAAASGPAGAKPVQTIDPVKLLKKYFWLLMVAGLVGIAVGVGSFLALRKFVPRYDSVVTFKVLPPTTTSSEIATGENTPKEPLERFMSTQSQIMVSDKVLTKALGYPGYQQNASEWIAQFTDDRGAVATSDAVRELQETVNARPLPKSQFIVLSVSYSKAGDAAFIAQKVTQAYMAELASDTDSLQDDLRETLTQTLTDLADDIALNERARDRIITENQLEALDTRLTEASMAMENNVDTLGLVQNQITSLISQQEEYERILGSTGGVIYPEDIRAAAESNPLVQQSLSAIQSLQAGYRAAEKEGLGSKHPAMVSLQARIDGMKEELELTRESIMAKNFNSMLDSIRRGLLQMRAQEASLLADIDEDKAKLNELAKLQQQIRELDRKIENLSERRDQKQADLDEIVAISQMKTSDRILVYQSAKIPDKMAFPDPKLIIPAGFLLFVGLTAGLIVLREMLDQRIKGPADVAMIPRTPILGIVPIASEDPSRPERPETAFHDRPTGIMAESIRQLRVGIVKKMQQAGHRSLLVVPATPQSGATTLVTNLSEACARADLKTLVIDANLRRPRIHGLFNLEANPGLVDILAGVSTIDDAICSTDTPNLDVLTVGSGEHRMFERIVTSPMSELLTKLEARYDVVLIDTAPAIVAGDAVGLAQLCGSTMLVARAMTEKRGTIARLKSELSDTRAEFLGVLINAVKPSAGGYLRKNYKTAHAYQQRGHKSAEA